MEALIPIFNRYPIKRMIIHPRIGEQMYAGRVDLDVFGACLNRIVHPVVYNGDINDPQWFAQLEQRFPTVSGWMMGRGLIANPFMPEIIKAQSTGGQSPISRFKGFHDDLVDSYGHVFCGPGHVLDRMKGFWRYFANGFSDGRHILKRIRKVTTLSRYQQLVAEYFDAG
jgi:tRNA-dihydrouridine synthase